MTTSLSLSKREKSILKQVDKSAKLSNWHDWRWQARHSIRELSLFETLLDVRFPESEKKALQKTLDKFPLAITPYYLSLINTQDMANDPIYRQAFPCPAELHTMPHDMVDPLHEDHDCPTPGITHRYPDRVLFLISNMCAMYCRHCTRKRRVGDIDSVPDWDTIQQGIDYIRRTPQVRDVLLSGGDPLILPDEQLDRILGQLRAIEHVEIIRIGSRTPVVLPYRITDELVAMLRKHHPLWLNTHFNHPREMTFSARAALTKLADAGIPLGNQSVLLAGVNDCPRIMRRLVHKLVQNRVRPYYLYQCDLSEGLSHFRTPVGKGIEILESLIGHTTGFCVPTYVIDAPGGGGKIPIMPNYLISWSTNKVVLRNYEGVITTYKEPDSYEPVFCDRKCDSCELQLVLAEADEYNAVGIEKLLADHDETIALVPAGNPRHERREEHESD